MITYVNTVLVGTGVGTLATSSIATATKGQYVIVNEAGDLLDAAAAANAEAIKVGLVTGKNIAYMQHNGTQTSTKEIKWSNIIKKADVKSLTYTPWAAETEDVVTFDFATAVAACADKDIRIVVRLTFKDMPTRYRKWSESYEVFAKAGSNAAAIVNEFVKIINVKDGKRARVFAEKDSTDALKVTALKYTDDATADSISPANKIRFVGNAWYTIPEADGFESKNKYNAAEINKTPGVYPTTATKLVRDAEAQAMGYAGILNRGECTWPIIKPGMNVDMDAQYETVTLEFENMYRTADDLQRRTKQTLQVFEQVTVSEGTATSKIANTLVQALRNFVAGKASATKEDAKKGTSDVEFKLKNE